MVRDALIDAHGWPAERIEIVPMVASGDRILDRALAEAGGKALWTRELDAALLAGSIDASVHSMKDVETERPATLSIAAMLPRADVRDRIVGAKDIAALRQHARIGTSAPRRRAQLLRLRPDLDIALLRGNVQTRLGKVAAGEFDATLLAAAGLDRLGLQGTGTTIPLDTLLPAPAQGAVGIEIASGNAVARHWIGAINHEPTLRTVMLERAFLKGLNGDCRSPVAACAEPAGPAFRLRAEIYAPDGREAVSLDREIAGDVGPVQMLARTLLSGAPRTIREVFGR
jgi:hydroxymethylbilane synthase